MHINYNNSRITLVHDLYLREWEWVDSEIACFAIVMSPWYSRGWTALELAQSHKVKILFKAKNDTYVIKDLDVDILANAPENHATANSIRKLRNASIGEFSALLAILGARDTSKPRDVPIISGLLAGVDVSGGLSQQEIYQRILRKLGGVAQGHLFHNSATMSAPGFSWCPTNILDMPMAESNSAMLQLHENGDLEGEWKVQKIESVKVEDLITRGTHPLTQVSLESAFGDEQMEKHVLLRETNEPKGTNNDRRALLVRLMHSESTHEIAAKFVGPVYFRAPPASGEQENVKPPQIKLRIGSTDGLQGIPGSAWDYVQKWVTAKGSATDEAPATVCGGPISKSDALPNDGGASDRPFRDWKAIFFLEGVPRPGISFPDKDCRIKLTEDPKAKSQDDMAMYFSRGPSKVEPAFQAFFYGNEGMVDNVRRWLDTNLHLATDKDKPVPLLLALGNDNQIKIHAESKEDDDTKSSLAAKALLLATEKDKERAPGLSDLINLFLEMEDPPRPKSSGKTQLQIALEGFNLDLRIAQTLLKKEWSPVTVDKADMKKQTALHLAAKDSKMPETVCELLVDKSNNLDAQDEPLKRTALHYAAQNGNFNMAKKLLQKRASPHTRDSANNVPLHFAASKGFDEIVKLLVERAKMQPSDSDNKEAIEPRNVPSEHPNRATEGDTNGVTGHDSEEDGGDRTGDEVDRSVKGVDSTSSNGITHSEFRNHEETSYPNVKDSKDQTPLHLAAKGGHLKVVKKLLEFKSSSFEQKDLDDALLQAAVQKNQTVIIELLKNGARSNSDLNHEGKTAFHWMIEMEYSPGAEILIKSQDADDVDVTDKTQKQSALLMASKKGLNSVVTLLLQKGADIKLKDLEGRTALHLAAMGSNKATIDTLLGKKDCPRNGQDKHKGTALHLAAMNRSAEVMELLVKDCWNDIEDEEGRTALAIAAGEGLQDLVKILLKAGSDPAHGKEGETALERAAALGRGAVVKELLPKFEEAGLKKRAGLKESALQLAAKAGHLSVALLLHESIKDPKDPALTASISWTILSAAAVEPGENGVPLQDLLDDVKNPNISDDKGQSLLMLATKNGHRELARHLISDGLSPNSRDNVDSNRTALMIAVIKNDAKMVEDLLHYGANPDLGDNEGYTALHHAVENECFDSFKVLLERTSKTIQDSRKRTALHLSLERICHWSIIRDAGQNIGDLINRHADFCDKLIESKWPPEIQDENGQNALHLAVAQNLKRIVNKLLADSKSPPPSMDTKDVNGQTPLLLAAAKGFTPLLEMMLDHDFEPNTKDKNGQVPLLLAAERGDDKSVGALLKHHADRNIQDEHGRTALSQAAKNGHQNVVKSLLRDLDKDTNNLNARDNMGRTALILAAENGHVSIVKTLVDKRANADVLGYDGKKAWQKAVDEGHAEAVESLLSDKDVPIQDRQAVNEALLLASRRGWAELVRVLLKQEVDLTFQSSGDKRTALHMAAMGGHRKVVEMLIEKGVDIVIKDRDGRTALFQATEQGFESIVKMLLDRKEIKADIDAWMGQESLLFAAEKGYDGIVKLLLDSNVNYNATDASERTAMVLAAANGKEGVVKRLLLKKASWAIKDKNQRTALHHAAWGGHSNIVETLLSHNRPVVEGRSVVDSSVVDNDGQSALHLAAERASIKAVQKLLDMGANVDAKCKDGQTALHRAAWGGSCEVVRLLRRRGADPFIRDNHNKRPWHVAAEKGHETIAVELLRKEESVYDDRILDQRGLIFAIKMGYSKIAKCLLNKNAEATVKDKDGRTPLHWAATRGDKELVKLLVENREVFIAAVDHDLRTALCLAVLNDRTAAVKILLQKGLQKGLDANIRDAQGQTALHHAAQRGNEEIAQILVKHNADPHIHDNDRRKAWQLAAEEGHHQVVRLLMEKEIDLSPHNQRREELLLKMSERDQVSMVQLLLELDVDKNVKDRFGRTAIGLAAEHGADDVLRLLLFKGADPTIADSRGQTPLLWAAKTGNVKSISLLVDKITSESDRGKKAKAVNHEDAMGRTALVVAIENKHDKAVKLLLDKCRDKCEDFIDVNVQDKADRTALQLAAEMGNNNWVNRLLDRNAKQGHKDSLGRTALLLAAEQGHAEVVTALLSSTKDHVNDADKQGRTPLQVATDGGYRDIVAALLNKGADPNAHDARSRTALLLATEHGDQATVSLLLEKKAEQDGAGKDGAGKDAADKHTADKDEHMALRLAVANGDRAVVEALLKHSKKYHSDAQDKSGRGLLELAVKSGNRDVAWLVAEMMTEAKREGK